MRNSVRYFLLIVLFKISMPSSEGSENLTPHLIYQGNSFGQSMNQAEENSLNFRDQPSESIPNSAPPIEEIKIFLGLTEAYHPNEAILNSDSPEEGRNSLTLIEKD